MSSKIVKSSGISVRKMKSKPRGAIFVGYLKDLQDAADLRREEQRKQKELDELIESCIEVEYRIIDDIPLLEQENEKK